MVLNIHTKYMWIYGGGGHARVLLDCLEAAGVSVTGIFDDDPAVKEIAGLPVKGPYDVSDFPYAPLIVAVGANALRRTLANRVKHRFGQVSHPSALVSARALIGEGSVLFHRSIVQSGSVLGKHVILNTAAIVEHDSQIGDFVHLAPGAILCGGVSVGEGTLIGAGTTILPGITIGKWCIVGAGVVINRPIPDYSLALGVPGRVVRQLAR
jgi:sugar O-acyltransferase (sialic acid O-acetyltransferase NeuD family)